LPALAWVLILAGCTVDAATGSAGAGGAQNAGGSSGTGTAGQGGTGGSGVVAGAGGASGSASTDDASAHDASSTSSDGDTPIDAAMADRAGDADLAAPDAARSNKVLIYGVTSPGAFRHGSIPAAATAIARAATAAGLTIEAIGTDSTNVVTPEKFTAAALSQYGAVILLANDGEPFGYPATAEIQNLVDFVQRGGALVSIECTTDCYGGAVSGPMTGHPKSVPFHSLLGATFQGHPGNFAPATCTKMGAHPSVAQLGMTFNVTDEIYSFTDLRADNQVVLTCTSSTDPRTVRPIAWVREEGSGRVFHTALGHPDSSWKMAMDPNVPSRLVEDHVLPGLLWAMRR
jgi:type 1 glutamine amidotransferase